MKKLFTCIIGILVILAASFSIACNQETLPTCPAPTGATRSETEIVGALAIAKTVTVSNAEATNLSKNYLPAEIAEAAVCFSPGQAHLSGKINAGVSVSFYVSGGIDLSGSNPKVTGLTVKLGGVPNLGAVTSQAEKTITDAVNQALSDVQLKKKYSVDFGAGTVTIKELAP